MSIALLGRRRRMVAAAVQPEDPEEPSADWFFEDTFAGGQLNPQGGFLYSNEKGDASSLQVVAAGDAGAQVKSGYSHSLRARYSARAIGEQNDLPQLNFTLPAQFDELLMEFDLHVPSNHWHRNNYIPPSTPETDNNKFWMLWGGPDGASYSQGYHQVACELTQKSASGAAASDGVSWTRPLMRWSDEGVYTDIASGVALIGPAGPIVPGSWNTVSAYTKKESALGAADGRFLMTVNGLTVHDFTGLRMGASDSAKQGFGLQFGYLFGWANSGFSEETTYHLQRLRFAASLPGA